MKQIKFKRGDTFSLSCIYNVNDVPESVDTFDIESQIRDRRGALIANLVATKGTEIGSFSLATENPDTSEWPVNTLQCDIQLTEFGVIRSTDTFTIVVVEEITK